MGANGFHDFAVVSVRRGGRLTRAVILGKTIDYNYATAAGCSAAANSFKNSNRSSVATTPTGGSAATDSFCYDQADRLVTPTTGVTSLVYDNRGNTTTAVGVSGSAVNTGSRCAGRNKSGCAGAGFELALDVASFGIASKWGMVAKRGAAVSRLGKVAIRTNQVFRGTKAYVINAIRFGGTEGPAPGGICPSYNLGPEMGGRGCSASVSFSRKVF